jgi:hypothetical protein
MFPGLKFGRLWNVSHDPVPALAPTEEKTLRPKSEKMTKGRSSTFFDLLMWSLRRL